MQENQIPMQEEVALAGKSSFQIGGRAKRFFEVRNKDELRQALNLARENNWPWRIVGAMTNVLLPDEDLELVIQLVSSSETMKLTQGRLEVWAGEPMAQIAWQTIKQGYQGLENFASLPGTVGGAIWNNAHYGRDFIADHLVTVEYLDLATGQLATKGREELAFGYDQSWFQQHPSVICNAVFQLEPAASLEELTETARAAATRRRETQPVGEHCAGCFWRNPANTPELAARWPELAAQERISAGFLIDQAGLKGTSVGEAQVSGKHAAFIVNRGGATSKQVQELAARVKEKVKAKFGVELEEEVKVM